MFDPVMLSQVASGRGLSALRRFAAQRLATTTALTGILPL